MKPNRPSLAALALITGLGSVPAIPVILMGSLLSVSACSGSSSAALTAANIAEAQLAVDGIAMAYNDTKLFPGIAIDKATDDQILANIASARALLAKLTPTSDLGNASNLQGISSILTQIANAAAAVVPAGSQAGTIVLEFQAAVRLGADLVTIANSLTGAPAKVGSLAVASRFQSSMSVSGARAALKR